MSSWINLRLASRWVPACSSTSSASVITNGQEMVHSGSVTLLILSPICHRAYGFSGFFSSMKLRMRVRSRSPPRCDCRLCSMRSGCSISRRERSTHSVFSGSNSATSPPGGSVLPCRKLASSRTRETSPCLSTRVDHRPAEARPATTRLATWFSSVFFCSVRLLTSSAYETNRR